MCTFIPSSIHHLQNHAGFLNAFSDSIRKYEKILYIALSILSVIALIWIYQRRAKKLTLDGSSIKKLDSDKSSIPPHVSPIQDAKPIDETKQDKKLVEKINLKIQEIASLPISTDFGGYLTYQNANEIVEKGGVILTKNCNAFGDVHYEGIAAVPRKDGSYCLHLCPGGGNLEFDEDQIERLMPEAIKTLVQQNITITKITDCIGRHPGDTLDNFKKWQAAKKDEILDTIPQGNPIKENPSNHKTEIGQKEEIASQTHLIPDSDVVIKTQLELLQEKNQNLMDEIHKAVPAKPDPINALIQLQTHVHRIFENVYLGNYRSYLSIDPKFIEKFSMVDPKNEMIDTFRTYQPELNYTEAAQLYENYKKESQYGSSKLNIQHVISVTQFKPGLKVEATDWSHFQPNLSEKGIERHQIPVDDYEFAWDTIQPHLNKIFLTIDKARLNNEPILIHCVEGKSRSVTVLLAYLIHCGASYDEALVFIQNIRPQAEPKPALANALKNYTS